MINNKNYNLEDWDNDWDYDEEYQKWLDWRD
jgi:hypothetical protein